VEAAAIPFDFSESALDVQARARAFTEEVLIPLEEEAERLRGRLPEAVVADVARQALDRGLTGGLHSPDHGGQGWGRTEWSLAEEQYGRSTNAIHWHIPNGYNVWEHASPEHAERWLQPLLRGEIRDAYAVTERNAGSDPSRIEATAVPSDNGGWVLNGEKWFVTGPDNTDFMIVQAAVVEGDERRPTLFLVDYDTPGVRMSYDPDYMHTFADRHPQFVLEDVHVPDAARLGAVGAADDLSNEWFVAERIHIGARCYGAMERLITLGVEWATERVQFGSRIMDFQGVSFPLANSAADASAARLLTREAAWLADAGADRKVVHAKASLAKLFASEAAFICADRVIQVFGGRGYMRDNPAERHLRELRVDRIWEGTSEIQRLIIARSLERRGVDKVVG
jgi:acyl-CoA dehydrogenase